MMIAAIAIAYIMIYATANARARSLVVVSLKEYRCAFKRTD